jgi:elongation factor Ts
MTATHQDAGCQVPAFGKSVADTIKDAVATIGENMSFRRSARLGVNKGAVATYVHNASPTASASSACWLRSRPKAMQKPQGVCAPGRHACRGDQPAVARRRRARSGRCRARARVLTEQARESGKPENVIEKMIEGRIRKFYEEVVLVKQAFVINPDLTVEKALKDAEKEIGAPAKITGFIRLRSARASRRKRATSLPKWRRQPRLNFKITPQKPGLQPGFFFAEGRRSVDDIAAPIVYPAWHIKNPAAMLCAGSTPIQ